MSIKHKSERALAPALAYNKQNIPMKELKKNFTKDGVQRKRMFKDSELVAYRCESEGKVWYELFENKVGKIDLFYEEEYEIYPTEEDFGVWAWRTDNGEKVVDILNEHFRHLECPLMNSEIAEMIAG